MYLCNTTLAFSQFSGGYLYVLTVLAGIVSATSASLPHENRVLSSQHCILLGVGHAGQGAGACHYRGIQATADDADDRRN